MDFPLTDLMDQDACYHKIVVACSTPTGWPAPRAGRRIAPA
jgi:hypothetical protein